MRRDTGGLANGAFTSNPIYVVLNTTNLRRLEDVCKAMSV